MIYMYCNVSNKDDTTDTKSNNDEVTNKHVCDNELMLINS